MPSPAQKQLSEASRLLKEGNKVGAARALGEGLHSIQDKWAHTLLVKDEKTGGWKRDASGSLVRKEVGWWEHLGRGILGKAEHFFTGKDTWNPDSEDRADFKLRYDGALQESRDYVRKAEAEGQR